MPQTHPIPVVVEQRSRAAQRRADQAVGLIIAIQCAAVICQVAIVIPGVGDAACFRHPIGVVIDVGDHLRARDRPRLRRAAVADDAQRKRLKLPDV